MTGAWILSGYDHVQTMMRIQVREGMYYADEIVEKVTNNVTQKAPHVLDKTDVDDGYSTKEEGESSTKEEDSTVTMRAVTKTMSEGL